MPRNQSIFFEKCRTIDSFFDEKWLQLLRNQNIFSDKLAKNIAKSTKCFFGKNLLKTAAKSNNLFQRKNGKKWPICIREKPMKKVAKSIDSVWRQISESTAKKKYFEINRFVLETKWWKLLRIPTIFKTEKTIWKNAAKSNDFDEKKTFFFNFWSI